jgi:diguanylate cyclase (GGDEF)-like protein
LFADDQPMNAATKAVSIVDRVELVRVRIFFGHANGNMASVMIGAVVIALVLHNGGVALRTLGAWGLAIGLASAGVLLFERYVGRVGVTVENCRQLAYVRIGLGAGIALFYGVSGFLLPGAAPAADTFLFIIVSTLVTVGALGYAVVPAYYLTLNAVSLLPLTGHFVQQYLAYRDNYYLLLVVVSIIWQVVVLTKARRVSLTAIDAIVLNERLKDEVEEHRRTREAMRHMALHDELTGLGNRRYFEETATRTLRLAARDQSKFGLLVVDLNDFKPVNDQHGHAGGDSLLRAVAARLLGAVRAADFCARMGGDEFAIVVASVHDDDDVVEVAEKLLSVLAEPFMLDTLVVQTSASVGWAVYPDDGSEVAELMAVADQRMYREKRSGKNPSNLLSA